jgi:hypothetical protein
LGLLGLINHRFCEVTLMTDVCFSTSLFGGYQNKSFKVDNKENSPIGDPFGVDIDVVALILYS